MKKTLQDFFGVKKPIIGMIHLSGRTNEEKVDRAIEELYLYQEEKVNGAIVEDYHGLPSIVFQVMKETKDLSDLNILRGVNCLRDYSLSFNASNNFRNRFIQIDSVEEKDLNLKEYNTLRKNFPEIFVLGGVGFKYKNEMENPLQEELNICKERCDAIVTTGSGTGIETPLEKLREYKKYLKNFPLIVGAGVNLENVVEQLKIADGAIVGSYFKKDRNTHNEVDKYLVREFVNKVKEIRACNQA